MPAPRWATKEQLELVRSYLPAYQVALEGTKKTVKRFWPTLQRGWFAQFPLKEELVASGVLPEAVLEKGYEFVTGTNEQITFKAAMERRTGVSMLQ